MSEFMEAYVHSFAIILPVLAVGIMMVGAAIAKLSMPKVTLVVVLAGTVFGLWYAAAMELSQAGMFRVPASLQETPLVLAFLFGGMLLVWSLAWLTPIGRQITLATPLSAIAAFQIPRIMGGVFLIGWLAGRIPPEFAIPAGLGDIWAGVAGYQASRALAAGAPNARRLLVRANLIGMGDIMVAVSLGIITSEGMFHVLANDAPNIINDYPLVLFPAFFVPIFLGFHLMSISRLRSARKQMA